MLRRWGQEKDRDRSTPYSRGYIKDFKRRSGKEWSDDGRGEVGTESNPKNLSG